MVAYPRGVSWPPILRSRKLNTVAISIPGNRQTQPSVGTAGSGDGDARVEESRGLPLGARAHGGQDTACNGAERGGRFAASRSARGRHKNALDWEETCAPCGFR